MEYAGKSARTGKIQKSLVGRVMFGTAVCGCADAWANSVVRARHQSQHPVRICRALAADELGDRLAHRAFPIRDGKLQ